MTYEEYMIILENQIKEIRYINFIHKISCGIIFLTTTINRNQTDSLNPGVHSKP